MDKIGSYGVYRNNYYDRTQAVRNESAAAGSSKETKASEQKRVELSDNAKNLLQELKKKYHNMDFIIADYETDEEAASYLSRGRAEYSVLFTPDELEKMASDASVKSDNLKVLDDAIAKLDDLKKQLGDKGKEVSRLGVAIGNDGEASFFAELEKVSEKQRERIEEKREKSREEAKKDMEEMAREKLDELRGRGQASKPGKESVKRTTVHASSVEELMEKIGQVDWDNVPDDVIPSGHKFDFTV